MSSELDKFVLQYTVDMKDAIQRLEQLNRKVVEVNQEAGKGKKEFQEFSSGAADELARVIPGVDKVTGAVRVMSGQFAIAATAVAALAVGIKAVMDYRTQLSEQRQTGMDVGVSGIRMEEYQRKFSRNSNGNITREQAAQGVSGFNQFLTAAYTDPTRMGVQARTLRMMGIDPGKRGQGQTSVNSALSQVATKFQGMSDSEVQGLAESMGMSKDFALTLKQLGPSIGKVTEMSKAEVKARSDSEAAMRNFNTNVADMNAKFTVIQQNLAQNLLPTLDALVTLILRLSNALPGAVNKTSKVVDKVVEKGSNWIDPSIKDKAKGWFQSSGLGGPFSSASNIGKWIGDKIRGGEKAVSDSGHPTGANRPIPLLTNKPTKTADKMEESVDKMLDKADKDNAAGRQIASDMSLAINMFAGSVATFANAIDERQAWASWAGEVGRAAGLGTQAAAENQIDPGRASKYDDLIEKAAKANNVSADLIRRVINAESSFDPNAESEVGAKGLMQIMDANKKALGIKNSFDPEQNIMGGARLLAENLKATGGNVREALMMYHAGPDRTGWGPKTMAYPGKVLGESKPTGNGESREKLQLKLVQDNIASRLGTKLSQLQLGEVNRGDVSWAKSQREAEYKNQIFDLQRQLQTIGLPQQTRSALITQLREQQTGLSLMEKYGQQTVDKAQPGERSITIGERAIVVNVMGSGDPSKTADTVVERLQDSLQDIANTASEGIKY